MRLTRFADDASNQHPGYPRPAADRLCATLSLRIVSIFAIAHMPLIEYLFFYDFKILPSPLKRAMVSSMHGQYAYIIRICRAHANGSRQLVLSGLEEYRVDQRMGKGVRNGGGWM